MNLINNPTSADAAADILPQEPSAAGHSADHSFRNFAKNIFILGHRYELRNRIKQDLSRHIGNVREKAGKKKPIAVNDIDYIEQKIHHIIEKERKLLCFNPVEQERLKNLVAKISALEHELAVERAEKEKLLAEKQNNPSLIEVQQLKQAVFAFRRQLHRLMGMSHRRKKELDLLEGKINKDVNKSAFYRN
ncbi:hypothetical protein HYX09_02450 [Candidatus Woesearchaeota archaeon]|nr:hypothetical protein [Candidatus Woesearchaeota archaeon]